MQFGECSFNFRIQGIDIGRGRRFLAGKGYEDTVDGFSQDNRLIEKLSGFGRVAFCFLFKIFGLVLRQDSDMPAPFDQIRIMSQVIVVQGGYARVHRIGKIQA